MLKQYEDKSFGYDLALHLVINMNEADCIERKITYRKYNGINIEEFVEEPQSSQQLSKHEGSVDELP